MTGTTCACPQCGARLKTTKTFPLTIKCPQCQFRFSAPAAEITARPNFATAPPAVGKLVSSAARRPSTATAVAVPKPDAPARGGSRVVLVAVVAGAAVLLAGGAAVAVAVAVALQAPGGLSPLALPGPPPAQAPRELPAFGPTPAPQDQPGTPSPRPMVDPLAGYVPLPPGAKPQPPVLPDAPKESADPVWSKLTPEQQARINRAIDQGVAFLKADLLDGKKDHWLLRLGGTALAGLALLACDVPADDPAVQKAVERVRAEGPQLTDTYGLALAVLFLDRLGDRRDRDLIRGMSLRLIAGQNAGGGWTYTCPSLDPAEQQQFLALLESISPPPEPGNVIDESEETPGEVPAPRPPPERRPPGSLPAHLKNLPVVKLEPGQPVNVHVGGDNSNTQFAILAVWAARKHGVPVDRTMALVESRFRAGQNADGSWGYTLPGNTRVDSMTCAGLLGLAVGRGVVRGEEAKKGGRDEAIEKGMQFLAKGVGKTADAGARGRGGHGKLVGANSYGDLYYLWSLERVAVAYDLTTVGGKDWYGWGSAVLVEHQNPDGSWSDAWAGAPDTCFALLFLKRTNVARDLTAKLKTLGNLIGAEDVEK